MRRGEQPNDAVETAYQQEIDEIWVSGGDIDKPEAMTKPLRDCISPDVRNAIEASILAEEVYQTRNTLEEMYFIFKVTSCDTGSPLQLPVHPPALPIRQHLDALDEVNEQRDGQHQIDDRPGAPQPSLSAAQESPVR